MRGGKQKKRARNSGKARRNAEKAREGCAALYWAGICFETGFERVDGRERVRAGVPAGLARRPCVLLFFRERIWPPRKRLYRTVLLAWALAKQERKKGHAGRAAGGARVRGKREKGAGEMRKGCGKGAEGIRKWWEKSRKSAGKARKRSGEKSAKGAGEARRKDAGNAEGVRKKFG